jgi:hypothetical protein
VARPRLLDGAVRPAELEDQLAPRLQVCSGPLPKDEYGSPSLHKLVNARKHVAHEVKITRFSTVMQLGQHPIPKVTRRQLG